MANRQLTRGSKGLWERLAPIMRALLPRQAWVTRSAGSTVWVRFNGESVNDPESEFISTVQDLTVGSMGWVITLAGKKGLFIATGIARPIPFSAQMNPNSTLSTTLLGTDVDGDANPANIQVPPGEYLVNAAGVVPVKRSVGTGQMWSGFSVGSAASSGGPANLSSVGAGANVWFPWGTRIHNATITVAAEPNEDYGLVTLKFSLAGSGTAGTTSIGGGMMSGTLTRIG